jgi:hypothetical protein
MSAVIPKADNQGVAELSAKCQKAAVSPVSSNSFSGERIRFVLDRA